MNIRRTTSILITSIHRLRHRHGFGVQSPWAYELVRDVFFERNHYYAYKEQHLNTESERQLYRIRNHFRDNLIEIRMHGPEALRTYDQIASSATASTVILLEHTRNSNADLWNRIVADPRAIVTFDLGSRGIVTFDPKRRKQNYTL